MLKMMCQSSLLNNNLEVESVGRMCTEMKMKNSSFVRWFLRSNENKIHMQLWAMKHELCNFNDSAHKFSAFIFAFNTGTVQYKE